MENELLRLKPMLLMQPSSGSSHQSHKGKSRQIDPTRTTATALNTTAEGKNQGVAIVPASSRKDNWKISVPSPSTASTMKLQTNPPTLPPPQSVAHASAQTPAQAEASSSSAVVTTAASAPRHKHRLRDHHHHHSSSSKRQSRTISANASLEFILVAAKRFGRKHVARVAGLASHIEREKELLALEQEQIKICREQDRLEAERQERNAGGGMFGQYYRVPGTGPASGTQESGAMSPPQNPSTHTQKPPTSVGTSAPVTSSGIPPRTPKRTHNVPHANANAGPSGTSNNNANNNTNTALTDNNSNINSPLVYVNVHTDAIQNGVVGSPSWGAGSGVIGTPKQIRSALHHHQRSGNHLNHNPNHGQNHGQNQKAGPSNPPTPLASLLDVALRMDMDDDDLDSRARGRDGGRESADNDGHKMKGKSTHIVSGDEHKRGRPLEEPESPVPVAKRRKVALGLGSGAGAASVSGGSGSSKTGPVAKHGPATNSSISSTPSNHNVDNGKHTSSTVGRQSGQRLERMKSALDVLADQADQAAAAYVDPDLEMNRSRKAEVVTSAVGASAKANTQAQAEAQRIKAKGSAKGKARADTDSNDVAVVAEPPKKKRGRPRRVVVVAGNNTAEKKDKRREQGEEDELDNSVDDSASASASVAAPPIRESSSSSIRGRPKTRGGAVPASASASAPKVDPSVVITTSSRGRPIRHASRKLAAMTPVSVPTATRGRGRPRGSTKDRSRANSNANPNSNARTSESASAFASMGEARVIMPPPAPRIIAHPPGYSPLDEAIALSSSSSSATDAVKQHQSTIPAHDVFKYSASQSRPHADTVPHTQTTHHYQSRVGTTGPSTLIPSPSLNLRPVVAWGNNNNADNNDSSTGATSTTPHSGRRQIVDTTPPPPSRKAQVDLDSASPVMGGEEKQRSRQVVIDDDEDRESREVSTFLTAPGTPATPAGPTTLRRPQAQEPEERQMSTPSTPTPTRRSPEAENNIEEDGYETRMVVDSPPSRSPPPMQVTIPRVEPSYTPTGPSQTTDPTQSPVIVVTGRVSTTPIPEEDTPPGDVQMNDNEDEDVIGTGQPPTIVVTGNVSTIPIIPLVTAQGMDNDSLESPTIVVTGRVATPVHVPAGAVDLDAVADVEMEEGHDVDAEGEEEDDKEEELEQEENTDPIFRDKPPDPPAPPPGGTGNGDNGGPPPPDQDEGHDPDADAEGEMEFEENEVGPPPGSSALAHYRVGSKTDDSLYIKPFAQVC